MYTFEEATLVYEIATSLGFNSRLRKPKRWAGNEAFNEWAKDLRWYNDGEQIMLS
jgi:hypothetical protein